MKPALAHEPLTVESHAKEGYQHGDRRSLTHSLFDRQGVVRMKIFYQARWLYPNPDVHTYSMATLIDERGTWRAENLTEQEYQTLIADLETTPERGILYSLVWWANDSCKALVYRDDRGNFAGSSRSCPE